MESNNHYQIHQLRCIHPHLDIKTTGTIISNVQSKLDYCNSLFYNSSTRQLKQLQHFQNSLALYPLTPLLLTKNAMIRKVCSSFCETLKYACFSGNKDTFLSTRLPEADRISATASVTAPNLSLKWLLAQLWFRPSWFRPSCRYVSGTSFLHGAVALSGPTLQ